MSRLLGHTCVDLITGLAGIAVGRIETISGTVQYWIQPRAADGKVPPMHAVDECMLLSQGVGVIPIANPTMRLFELGQRVREAASGITGIIVARADYVAGCRHFGILTPAKDDKVGEWVWFDEKRFTLVDEGIRTASTRTGGPSIAAPVTR